MGRRNIDYWEMKRMQLLVMTGMNETIGSGLGFYNLEYGRNVSMLIDIY